MRAIITCRTELTKDQFKETLQHLGWWPQVSQDDQEAQKHKSEILKLVAPEDKGLVKSTAWYMVYRYDSEKTWGLVNSPQQGIIEIRLKNPSPVNLRLAVENFIEQIQSSPEGKKYFFRDMIEVLEPNSLHRAFYGEPLPTHVNQKWKLALRDRSWEWKAGSWLVIAAAIFILLSTPWVMSLLSIYLSHDWITWTEGVIGRLATSALISAVTFFLTVIWHFQELQRFGSVRWRLEINNRNLMKIDEW